MCPFVGTCTKPTLPANAYALTEDKTAYALGEKYSIVCLPSFTLSGTSDLVCQTGGTWSNSPPTCVSNSEFWSLSLGVFMSRVVIIRGRNYKYTTSPGLPLTAVVGDVICFCKIYTIECLKKISICMTINVKLHYLYNFSLSHVTWHNLHIQDFYMSRVSPPLYSWIIADTM